MTRSISFAIGLALAAMTAPAIAQQGSDQAQARQMFEKVITFRTSPGQGQVPPMASYLEGVLREGGIPAENIAKVTKGETIGMMVRIPGTRKQCKADPVFGAYGCGRCAARGLEARPI